MEIYSPVSRIIAAYDSGVAKRRQREQDKYKQEQDRLKLEQEEKDRQQRVKEFEATHKQLGESMQLQKKAQEARDAYQRFQVTQAVKQAVAEGRMKIPTQEILKSGSNWAEANPQTEQVYSDYKEPNTGVVIPGAEFQSPVDYRKALADLDLAKQSGEIEAARQRELARQQEIADRNAEWDRRDAANFKQQNAMFDRQTERMFGMLGARNTAASAVSDRRDRTAIVNLADKIKTDPMYKQWQGANTAYKYVTEVVPDPNAPGINDMKLIYTWIKGLDESVVRPSEYETVVKVGVPWLQAKGLAIKRLTDNQVILPPATRAAIIRDIKDTYRVRGSEWNKLMGASRARAKYLDPDISDNDFNNLIYSGTYQEEGKPVILVPKGGKK